MAFIAQARLPSSPVGTPWRPIGIGPRQNGTLGTLAVPAHITPKQTPRHWLAQMPRRKRVALQPCSTGRNPTIRAESENPMWHHPSPPRKQRSAVNLQSPTTRPYVGFGFPTAVSEPPSTSANSNGPTVPRPVNITAHAPTRSQSTSGTSAVDRFRSHASPYARTRKRTAKTSSETA